MSQITPPLAAGYIYAGVSGCAGMERNMKKFAKLIKAKALVPAFLAASALMLSACGGANADNTGADNTQPVSRQQSVLNGETASAANEQETKTEPEISGVDTISLYLDHKDTGIHELADEYSSAWVKGQDIVSFDAFGCGEQTFSAGGKNFRDLWESYWTQYDGYENSKIGYIVSFKLKSGEEIRQTITDPEDVFSYRNYLENYLYDDINQVQGEWYSHLLQSEVNEKTRMTSIKFTAGQDIDKVGDTITLTAFVYNSDSDFDSQGNYTGNVSYTVTIKNTAS